MGEISIAEEISLFRRMVGTFFSPGQTFEAVEDRCTWADWVIPVAVVAAFTVLFVWWTYPIAHLEQIEMSRERLEQQEELSEEQKEEELKRVEAGVELERAAVMVTVMVFVGLFIQAAIFFFGAQFILQGDRRYKDVLAVTAYSMLVGVPAAMVRLLLTLSKGTMKVQTSLSFFLSPEMEGTFVYRLFSGVDFFTFWQMCLMSIGIGIVYGMPFKRTGTMVFVFWGIWIVIGAVLPGGFEGSPET